MRTAAKVFGWILIISFTFHAVGNVIRATSSDTIDNAPRGESAYEQLAASYRSRPLGSQLFMDLIFISTGVVLVIVGRPKETRFGTREGKGGPQIARKYCSTCGNERVSGNDQYCRHCGEQYG